MRSVIFEMDQTFILRFPQIAQTIFEELDDQNLVKCKEVNKEWRMFLKAPKFLLMRKIQKAFEKRQCTFGKVWWDVAKCISTRTISEIEVAATEFFRDDSMFQWPI